MKNVFSIDLEDWFFLPENQKLIKASERDSYVRNFISNVYLLLDLLKINQTKATFFVLGKAAQEIPYLIQRIKQEGHEIACHSHSHKKLFNLTESEFREDLEQAMLAIDSACGVVPKGYRAPAFSITNQSQWALPILREYGFVYDSSIYPISLHPGYGIKDHRMDEYRDESGLLEFPMTCSEFLGLRIPVSGGGYFRHYPYPVFRYLFDKAIAQGRRGIFYFHPWELSHSYPKENLGFVRKHRHFNNIDKTFSRLKRLLHDYNFTSFENIIKNWDSDDERESKCNFARAGKRL
jgi:peptidoglycan-N-acetylglucosamine deacetylase